MIKLFGKIVNTDARLSPFILRVVLAICIFPHGAQKLLGWFDGAGFSKIVDGFQSRLGILPVFTVLVIIAEFFGAVAMLFGFLTRVTAIAYSMIMTGAIFLGHQWDNGFLMNYWGKRQGEGWEYNLLIIGVSIALVISGSGRYSVDGWLMKKQTS